MLNCPDLLHSTTQSYLNFQIFVDFPISKQIIGGLNIRIKGKKILGLAVLCPGIPKQNEHEIWVRVCYHVI